MSMSLLVLSLPSRAQPDGYYLHAPDGFLHPLVALPMWALTLTVLLIALRRAERSLDERAIPLMGVTAAFIFAAQLINFPVAGGTSGHLLGAVLAAILLGPWVATLVMACVVGIQALVFQDGGLLAMGANILDMGIVGALGGYALYATLCRLARGDVRARMPAAALAAWTAVVAGALAMSLQLAASGTTPVELTLPVMLGVHGLIGVGEAAITLGALALIRATRPDLLALREESRMGTSLAAPAASAAHPVGTPEA